MIPRKMIKSAGILAAAAAMMALAACRSEQPPRTRLTQQEMADYGKAIAGEYDGAYVILRAVNPMPGKEDEDGGEAGEMAIERLEGASITVTDYDMRSIIFHQFPISTASHLAAHDEALQSALAETSGMDLTAQYGWSLHTDGVSPVWEMGDIVASLTLAYGGEKHNVLFRFKSGMNFLLNASERDAGLGFGSTMPQFSLKAVLVDGEQLPLPDNSLLVFFTMQH